MVEPTQTNVAGSRSIGVLLMMTSYLRVVLPQSGLRRRHRWVFELVGVDQEIHRFQSFDSILLECASEWHRRKSRSEKKYQSGALLMRTRLVVGKHPVRLPNRPRRRIVGDGDAIVRHRYRALSDAILRDVSALNINAVQIFTYGPQYLTPNKINFPAVVEATKAGSLRR